MEYFGRVDTKKLNCRGCDRIFWWSRYVEIEMSMMRKNILVEWIRRNAGVTDAKEYFGRVDT